MPNNSYENPSRDAKPEPMTCSICGKALPCGGHKTGGGGEEDSPKDDAKMASSSKSTSSMENAQAPQRERGLSIETVGLVTIYNDDKNGNLTILSKKELSKDNKETLEKENLLSVIKAEFDEFKNSLESRGIQIDKFNVDLKGNKLTINIPSLKHYDDFIQQLYQKQLLHEDPAQPQEKKNASIDSNIEGLQEQERKKFNPSPFSMKLERK